LNRARRGAAVLAGALLIAAAAGAQHDVPVPRDIPDVPAGPATLRGQVTHAEDPARAAGVEVMLYALPAGASPGLRRATSDAEGRFAFEHISNDPQVSYLIGARYAGIPFPGTRVAFASGETEKRVAIHIGEATENPSAVSVAESQLRLAWQGARIGVDEVHKLENRGPRTLYVPAARRGSARPAFQTRLPAGSEGFDIPLGIAPEGLIHEGDDVRFFGPLYPSGWPDAFGQDQGLSFHYTLPASSKSEGGGKSHPVEIRKVFPAGAKRVVVVAPAGGPALRVAGAHEEKTPAAEGAAAAERRFVVDGVAPGAALVISLELPPTRTDPAALALDETRIFLELDDAALQVREEHHFKVSGETPIVAPAAQALLAIPLPNGAADLRFDRDAFAWGLQADGHGGVELTGPLPPGENDLELAYHLPLSQPGGEIAFERRFGRALPLLSVYVADTGLRADSERLHRRRPVLTSDRTYLHLEAFEVEPGETIRVDLSPLRAAAAPPRGVLLGLVALAVAGVAAFLVAPLRGSGAAPAVEAEDSAWHERDAVYAALGDLEHDHETAKVSDEDYAAMRRELRARAAALIREERAAGAARPAGELAHAGAAEPPPRFCASCGADVRPADRFCAQCGASLAAREREASG